MVRQLLVCLLVAAFSASACAQLVLDAATVKEGMTWRYHSDLNVNMEPSEDISLDMCFSGTTVIDGKEYLDCYVWKTGDGFSSESAALIAHMREEDGKVYVRYIPDAHVAALEKGIDIIPYAPMMSILDHDQEELSKKDVLLFDPNLEVGDNIYCTGTSKQDSQWFEVVGIENMESMGSEYPVYSFRAGIGGYGYSGRIGSLEGLLPIPCPEPVTYGVEPWKLVEVIDNAGNVIFSASNAATGVDAVGDGKTVVKETWRTLGGVETRIPTVGGVYLKTTTFSNGETRTGKVVVR